jgi:hypothetical protein
MYAMADLARLMTLTLRLMIHKSAVTNAMPMRTNAILDPTIRDKPLSVSSQDASGGVSQIGPRNARATAVTTSTAAISFFHNGQGGFADSDRSRTTVLEAWLDVI